jgi:hypothetical protein
MKFLPEESAELLEVYMELDKAFKVVSKAKE